MGKVDSTDMADEFATRSQLRLLEEKVTTQIERVKDEQKHYEEKCELDRKVLRGEIQTLETSVNTINEKLDAQNLILNPMAESVRKLANTANDILSQPRVKQAFALFLVAIWGYGAYKLHSLTPQTQTTTQILIPVTPATPAQTATYHLDGGFTAPPFGESQP